MEKMKNDNKNLKILALLFCALVLFWMLFSFRSKAASDQDYFPMQQGQNDKFSQGIVDKLNSVLDSSNNYIFVSYAFDSGQYRYFNYVTVPMTSNNGIPCIYGEKNNDLIHFTLYKNPNNITVSSGQINFDTTNPNRYGNIGYGNTLSYFGNMVSSNYSNSTSYMSNFIVYTNNTSARKIVLFYDDGNYIPDGDTAREDMDKPNSSDYYPDWTNAPTFDNSSVENALQSIFNYFVWFGGNIKGTIEGLGNFISDTVRWSIQKVLDKMTTVANGIISGISNKINDVITTIGGKIDTFTSKLEDLYDGFTEFADLFIHPFDEEEYEEQISNCQLISQYDELMENCEDVRAIFNNAEERDYFVLYIDFENPFADSEHKIIHSEISFTWLKDYRTTYRPFLWVFTMIECFVGGMRLLGGIIGGKAK